MNKFYFIFDKTAKSQRFKKSILRKYKNFPPKKSNFIIVAGGDGFMLNSLKKCLRYNKPFYGINCGTFGFLMNSYTTNNLEKRIKNARTTIINPLEILSLSKKNKKKLIAFNEISLFRQSKQTVSLRLKIKNKIIIKKLVGDGVLVSTPAGSTAYNLSVHGPILNLNSEKLAITPISAFRPRRWKGKIISNKYEIEITNLDKIKRPVAAVADNVEVRDILSLKIKINKNIKVKLLHDKDKSLFKKIKIEQLRKNIR
jgi:NAD+ kinase